MSMVLSRNPVIFFLLLLLLHVPRLVIAQDSIPVTVTATYAREAEDQVVVTVKFAVKPGVRLYTLQKSETDLLYSVPAFDSLLKNSMVGTTKEYGKIQKEVNKSLGGELSFATDSLRWTQIFSVPENDSVAIKGDIIFSYQIGDEFYTHEKKIKLQVLPNINAGNSNLASQSLLWIFLAAFAGGLLALLTPCVYSMIPITVSYFTKRSENKAQGVKNALYYALSIVMIFTLLGFLITTVFGPAALNNLATNWIANMVFFVLFLLFGLSFLGAFEIKLPGKWLNKADAKSGSGNFVGIFFMALTLVLVSFSCTGPIIGNLLVLAAKGSFLGPLVSMFGFSLALALPFALFAFFPSKLNVLGKAGGWLNAIKVTLGFLELALALKFLSNADLARGWRLLDREIFIVLWMVIFFLLGLYLLGKIRFKHDDSLPKNDFGQPYLSVTRLVLVILSFGFSLYMLPGLFGAPLKGISAFVPPMGTQDFTISGGGSAGSATVEGASHQRNGPKLYVEQMRMYEPEVVTKYGLVTYYDYEEALAVSKKENKPLMLDFTGINCVNCRKMEGQVWSDPAVMKRLKEDFIVVSLYVDVHHIELPEAQQYFSKDLDKQVATLGDKNAEIQVKHFGANTQPYYFFIDGNEKRLVQEGYGYDPNIQKFIEHLDKAKAAFGK